MELWLKEQCRQYVKILKFDIFPRFKRETIWKTCTDEVFLSLHLSCIAGQIDVNYDEKLQIKLIFLRTLKILN